MKKTFTTVDVAAIVAELKQKLIGLRVNQIYDIDHKTYLIKLHKPDHKVILLLESASRIHTTEYEWPKSPAPSGFAMKLRKHLRNKRLESINQLGVDRVVDFCFGSGEAANHLIVEVYDRGNIVLTDGEYNILNVLRPRKEGEDTKIIVREKYPIESARTARNAPSLDELHTALSKAKEFTSLKKILNPMLDCGGAVLENELLRSGIPSGAKIGKDIEVDGDLGPVLQAVSNAQQSIFHIMANKGYIIKKAVQRPKSDGSTEEYFLFMEFHPELYIQNIGQPYDEFSSFNKACDEFFSNMEANELDKKAVEQEKQAMKKLANVKQDNERRIQELQARQDVHKSKGQLIELNQDLVDGALLVIRSALANQIDWAHIEELLTEAQIRNDPVACSIRDLKLITNTMTLWLSDPYDCDQNDMLLDSDEEREDGTESEKTRPMAVDINLDTSALANARRYFNMRRTAAKKEQKTIDASSKAIKSAVKKTQQTLKEVSTITNINKARKVHWFEKFLWFISSENYLVIGGRDGQQNEMVVKRHLKPKDIYVHGDLHGASSVIVKNPTGGNVPPRTLHEAGIMALCYSRAWDEKVVTSAWWVWGHQVSKTAPTGEYLTTGSFMVRGKKNFLPPSHLVYGFGLVFRLEESSVQRHLGERKVRIQDEQLSTAITDALERLNTDVDNDDEISLDNSDDDNLNEEKSFSEEKNDNQIDNNECNKENNMHDKELEMKKEINIEEEEETNIEEHVLAKKKDENIEDNSKTNDESINFPDIELEMSHFTGDQFTFKLRENAVDDDENLAKRCEVPDLAKNISQRDNDCKTGKNDNKVDPEMTVKEDMSKSFVPPKRGQKGKLKKMKKYKDQDEEEKELRMQLLQSAGTKKLSKKEKSRMEHLQKLQNRRLAATAGAMKQASSDKNKKNSQENKQTNAEEVDDEDVPQVPDDLSILDCLTAVPVAEDELLYAVPVCAPYSSMTNYKYKVKLTPGPGKKGKATKTALSLFMADKGSSTREKDLFRAIKDHDLAKNLPGKVKISAPHISKVRK